MKEGCAKRSYARSRISFRLIFCNHADFPKGIIGISITSYPSSEKLLLSTSPIFKLRMCPTTRFGSFASS